MSIADKCFGLHRLTARLTASFFKWRNANNEFAKHGIDGNRSSCRPTCDGITCVSRYCSASGFVRIWPVLLFGRWLFDILERDPTGSERRSSASLVASRDGWPQRAAWKHLGDSPTFRSPPRLRHLSSRCIGKCLQARRLPSTKRWQLR